MGGACIPNKEDERRAWLNPLACLLHQDPTRYTIAAADAAFIQQSVHDWNDACDAATSEPTGIDYRDATPDVRLTCMCKGADPGKTRAEFREKIF